MSHIVEIKTEVRDEVAIGSACQRLKLDAPIRGTAKLFSSEATGVIVKLPDWRYPAVFDTQSGQAQFDNYGGRWGEQVHLIASSRAMRSKKQSSKPAGKGTASRSSHCGMDPSS